MAKGVLLTLNTLEKTKNQAAGDLLIELMIYGLEEHRSRAYQIFMDRNLSDWFTKLVERFNDLPPELQSKVIDLHPRISQAIHNCYLSENLTYYHNSCDLIRRIPDYDQLSLLTLAMDTEDPRRQEAISIVQYLTNRLLKKMLNPREFEFDYESPIIKRYLRDLKTGINTYNRHRSKTILRSYLLMMPSNSEEIYYLCLETMSTYYRDLMEIFSTDTDPRILRWFYFLLNHKVPPAGILKIVGQRTDKAFLDSLFSNSEELAQPAVAFALRQIKFVEWLKPDQLNLDKYEEYEQLYLIIMCSLFGIPNETKLQIYAHVLDEGYTIARRAAACAIRSIPGHDANAVISECLNDEDPDVVLAAIRQIRSRGYSNNLNMLLKFLDSSQDSLRKAAQEELKDYRFSRYFKIFDQMEDPYRKAVGSILLRIDPDSFRFLETMLKSENQQLCIRTMHVIRTLSITDGFLLVLLEKLSDPEHIVRREAAETIARVENPEIIRQLCLDIVIPAIEPEASYARRGIELISRDAIRPNVKLVATDLWNKIRAGILTPENV